MGGSVFFGCPGLRTCLRLFLLQRQHPHELLHLAGTRDDGLAVDEEVRHPLNAQLLGLLFIGTYGAVEAVGVQHIIHFGGVQPHVDGQCTQYGLVADVLPFGEIGAQEALLGL